MSFLSSSLQTDLFVARDIGICGGKDARALLFVVPELDRWGAMCPYST